MKAIKHLFKYINIKFTKAYLHKLCNENPYQDTLFGISNRLSENGIKHTTFKVNDLEELKSLEPPFIVNFEENTILIDQITDTNISYIQEGKRINVPFDRFIQAWDKTILSVEMLHNSKGSNYIKFQRQYLLNIVRTYTFILAGLILSIAGLATNDIYRDWGVISLLTINMLGIYISWLLIQKQQHIPNGNADRICSMIKNGNCNSVLASPASKIMGVIGWSEIGLGYFISNSLITIFAPHLIPYLAVINIAGLPYSIWSIWYQKCRVKQWCPLCLIVQILMWMMFISNLLFAHITIPSFLFWDIVLTGCIYLIPLLTINALSSKFNKERYIEFLEKELEHLKLNPDVFKSLLHQQPHYEVSHSTSTILWGNKNAKLIVTIVTNPHCYYCAKTHEQIERLLTKATTEVCIQYIFYPIEEKYELSNKFLISVYLSNEISKREKKEIYDHWFIEGRMNKEEFIKGFNIKVDPKIVLSELQSHKEWEGSKNIDGTPTIFINGYQLPHQYGISDLIYFSSMNI